MTVDIEEIHELIAEAEHERRAPHSCKVCGAVPDADGCREHGGGCFTQQEDGGGSRRTSVFDYVDVPPDPLLAALPALLDGYRELAESRGFAIDHERMTAAAVGCPCCHTTPCHDTCSCISPLSSSGCWRCCTYGSPEQQRSRAVFLAGRIDPQSLLSDETLAQLEKIAADMRDVAARGKLGSK